jgi:hypothetical protein
MILDNADNADLFFPSNTLDAATQASTTKKPLVDYLPKRLAPKQSLIITTRNGQLGKSLSHEEPGIEVLPFSLREATALLRYKAGKISESWNDQDPERLAELLGCILLALTQAAAFIKRNRMSLLRYRESLEDHERNVNQIRSTCQVLIELVELFGIGFSSMYVRCNHRNFRRRPLSANIR